MVWACSVCGFGVSPWPFWHLDHRYWPRGKCLRNLSLIFSTYLHGRNRDTAPWPALKTPFYGGHVVGSEEVVLTPRLANWVRILGVGLNKVIGRNMELSEGLSNFKLSGFRLVAKDF